MFILSKFRVLWHAHFVKVSSIMACSYGQSFEYYVMFILSKFRVLWHVYIVKVSSIMACLYCQRFEYYGIPDMKLKYIR